MRNLLALASVVLLVNVSCGKSSNPNDKNAPAALTPETPAAPADANTDAAAAASVPPAVVSFEVDATNKEAFVYLDLDAGKIVADTDASWDLAFKRTVIKMNGTGVATAVIKDSTFDAVLSAPPEAFLSDAPVAGGKEIDGLVFHAADSWYSYDIEVHVITSRGYNYLVKTNGGAEFKLTILDYYNVDRLPAFLQLKWQKLPAAPAALSIAE